MTLHAQTHCGDLGSRYITVLLVELTPKGVVFSFLSNAVMHIRIEEAAFEPLLHVY